MLDIFLFFYLLELCNLYEFFLYAQAVQNGITVCKYAKLEKEISRFYVDAKMLYHITICTEIESTKKIF